MRERVTRWRSRVARLWRVPWKDRFLVIEALLGLGLGRLVVLLLPFRWTSARLGRPQQETRQEDDPHMSVSAQRIGGLIQRVGRHTPWRSKCLEQALTAHVMLRRRRIPSTLYLGLRKERDRLDAHAWLRCGSRMITGGHGHARFTTVTSYAWDPAPSRTAIPAQRPASHAHGGEPHQGGRGPNITSPDR